MHLLNHGTFTVITELNAQLRQTKSATAFASLILSLLSTKHFKSSLSKNY